MQPIYCTAGTLHCLNTDHRLTKTKQTNAQIHAAPLTAKSMRWQPGKARNY
jgi:hypothetical protein